jgi:hypothetical protein
MAKSKSNEITLPIINNNVETKNVLTFTMSNANVSVINALRRTILADIEVVCMKTSPYHEGLITFEENTCRFNNEILKHRLSCIPVHLKDLTEEIDKLVVEIDEENTSDSVKYITTKDFKIKDITTDRYLEESFVNKVFPPDPITKNFILFARLKPKITNNIPGEKIHLQCKLSKSTAKVDGAFNVASTCAYGNTPDIVEQNNKWDSIEEEMVKNGVVKSKIEYERTNWFLHDAKRIYKYDSFDFTLESVGVYSNVELMRLACDSIIDRNNKLYELFNTENILVKNNQVTIENSYDIILDNIDYTIGKVIEYLLHEEYYKNQKIFNYVGFLKAHPHDTFSMIRIGFNDEKKANITNINEIFKHTLKMSNQIFQNVKEYF